MLLLILGLILFLGMHSARLFVADKRASFIAAKGPLAWKGIYALVSIVGFVLIIYGYGQARMSPTWLWISPVWTRHLAALLTIPAFILIVATYIPGSCIKARVGHPMLLGVKFWALAHLIANGSLADLLLFGGFLAWATALFVVSRKRDRAAGVSYGKGKPVMDAVVVVVGLVAWAAFAFYLHGAWIGVKPMGV
ncbi:MAG TPA: NnrU family protein [Pseudomonas sp.]|nr:NnrU family protein [Pseudomonas sp.]MBF78129.1 NnrU family protein [Pseudomonadales bacterium]HCA23213.1 NnrU family protein [Pseudomonas sp.]HCB42580.1 NnrU family protein [Pseudomonas sp.]|tara:strand:- start:37 stop:618 length:582 start_codon:yes stop_codon:yes gene_type:complete